jgi:hypothetical protein
MIYPYAAPKFMLAQDRSALPGGAELSRTPMARHHQDRKLREPDMTYSARAGPAQPTGPPPPRWPADDVRDPRCDGDVRVLGQGIAARLFIAGLDLHSALTLIADGPVADRLYHAIAELDGAIRDLRHLVVALPGPTAGASRTPSAAALSTADTGSSPLDLARPHAAHPAPPVH